VGRKTMASNSEWHDGKVRLKVEDKGRELILLLFPRSATREKGVGRGREVGPSHVILN